MVGRRRLVKGRLTGQAVAQWLLMVVLPEQKKCVSAWQRTRSHIVICAQDTCSAAYVLKRDSANDITITQMFITLAIMLEVY